MACAERWGPIGTLTLLAGVGVLLLALLGRSQHVPVIFPDELIYGGMAKSLVAGDGATLRGIDPGVSSLFPQILGVAWGMGSSVPDGYAYAKVLTAALFVLTVVPLWLALKEPLGRWLALAPCAVLLVGPWSEDSSKLLTESLALPVVTSSIALLWWGLRRQHRSRAKIYLAFFLMAIAAVIRPQLAIMLPAFALAIALNAILQAPAERKQRLNRFAPELIAVAALSIAGAMFVFATNSRGLGVYSTARDFGVGLDAIQRSFEYVAILPIYGLLLPPLVFVALIGTRNAWRDPSIGPLLAILVSAAVTLALVSGWFVAGVGTTVVERYMVYLVPWLLALPLLGLRILTASKVLIATAFVAFVVVIPISVDIVSAAEGFEGGRHVFGSFFGLLGVSSPAITFLIVVVLGLLFAVLAAAPGDSADNGEFSATAYLEQRFASARDRMKGLSAPSVAIGVTVTTLLLGVAVSEWRWSRMASIADTQITLLPVDLDWVDAAVGKDRSVAMVSFRDEMAGVPLLYTEFFNESIDRVFAQTPKQVVGLASVCQFKIDPDGRLVTDRSCAKAPSAVLAFGSRYQVSTKSPAVSVVQPDIGRLTATTGAPTELHSLVVEPCQPTGQCSDYLSVELWLDEPATVTATFSGGGKAGYTVSANGRDYEIPAEGPQTIAIDAPSGAQEARFELGWATTALSPRLESVKLGGEEIYAVED